MQIHNPAFRKRPDGGEINSAHKIPSLNFTLKTGKIYRYNGSRGRIYKIHNNQHFWILKYKWKTNSETTWAGVHSYKSDAYAADAIAVSFRLSIATSKARNANPLIYTISIFPLYSTSDIFLLFLFLFQTLVYFLDVSGCVSSDFRVQINIIVLAVANLTPI